jgi:hypothetical protein
MLCLFCGQFRLDRRYLMPQQREIYWRVAHEDIPNRMRRHSSVLQSANWTINVFSRVFFFLLNPYRSA